MGVLLFRLFFVFYLSGLFCVRRVFWCGYCGNDRHAVRIIVGGIVFFSIFLLCWPGFMSATLGNWFADDPGLQIALFHTFFNVVCTCIFLPFAQLFVKAATKLIREKKGAQTPENDCAALDERLIKSPSVAVNQAVINIRYFRRRIFPFRTKS